MTATSKKDRRQFSLIENSDVDAADEIRSLHTPELVIALCCPIGSPLHEVAACLQEKLLNKFGYAQVESIRLSEFISSYARKKNDSIPENGVERIKKLIHAGNSMRDERGKEILAKLAINKIAQTRAAVTEALNELDEDGHSVLKARTRPIRVAHIVDSIKNQSELEILRLVYGDLLYTIGVYAPISSREATLKK